MNKIYSPRDAERLRVIYMYLKGVYTRKMAAMNLDITERQLTRIVQRFIDDGPESVIHGNTGSRMAAKYPEDLCEKICSLYKGKYGQNGVKLNFCHFQEKLLDEDIDIPYSSLRSILINGGISPPGPKPDKKASPPRPRRLFAGELLQVDGSTHRWLYNDFNLYTMHGGIDDALGIVTGLWLEKSETMHGYQMVLRQTMEQYGIPKCLYTDNRNIFTSSAKSKTKFKLNSPRFRTMLTRLGIDVISTSNSRAKGRIERVWRTLQDRLLNEIKLRKITTLDEANAFIKEYLPTFNKRFASAIDPNRNSFRKVPADYDYNQNLSLFKEVQVHDGCYIAMKGHYYIIRDQKGKLDSKKLHLPKSAELHQFLDDSYHILVEGKWYDLEDIGPKSLHSEITSSISREGSKNSPWRQFNPNYFNRERSKWDDENLRRSPFA